MPLITEPALPVEPTTPTAPPLRLWLMAHAPVPPESWVEGQRDRHKTVEGIARARNHSDRVRPRHPGDPEPPFRTPIPAPTDMDLDIRWRLAWADRALQLNNEE